MPRIKVILLDLRKNTISPRKYSKIPETWRRRSIWRNAV